MSEEISDDQVRAAGTDDQVLAAGTDDQVLAADDQVPAAGTVVPDATGNAQLQIPLRLISKATKKFRIKNLIGHGRSAHVYKGKFGDGQVIAVKRLKPATDRNGNFRNEVNLLSRLNHPNIIRMLGFCNDVFAEEKIIVYNFMPLGSLFDHLHARRSALNWDRRMRIATGVATGLDYLHKLHPPIVYRNLKPTNVLLGDGYHPRISDFRVARSTSFTDTSTVVMGTPPYWAPENARENGYSVQSDVYSFGALLMDMLIGYVPLDTHFAGAVAPWVRTARNFAKMVDPEMDGQIEGPKFKKALDLALLCMNINAAVRPQMERVVIGMRHLSGDSVGWDFDED